MGSCMNCHPVHRVLGLGRRASCSAAWSGIWEETLSEQRRQKTQPSVYIVWDEDPLVVVGELPEVGGGGVPALGGAEGDGVTGAGINISFDSGHHLVLGTSCSCSPSCSTFWPCQLISINTHGTLWCSRVQVCSYLKCVVNDHLPQLNWNWKDVKLLFLMVS